MEAVIARLFKCFDRKKIGLEVEEELRFHIELLRQEHIQRGMSPEEAKDAALKRFGDVEQIKNQCVGISRRSYPFMRALESFLILVFLVGVLVRVFETDPYVRHVGDMLIAVAVLSRLLLYVRGLSPPSFLPKKTEASSLLTLNDVSQMTIAAYNERRRTPIERVLSDEQPSTKINSLLALRDKQTGFREG